MSQENISSGDTDTTSGNNQQSDTNANDGQVAYASHKKLLGEKKNLQVKYDDMAAKYSTMEEDKLKAEGNKDALLESYKTKIDELEGKVNGFAYSSVSSSVRMKAQEMGCVDAEAVVKHLDLSALNVGSDFSVDSSEVSTMLEAVKKEKPYFFTAKNPNIINSNPNTKPDLNQAGKVDFSKMSKDELKAYGEAHNIK